MKDCDRKEESVLVEFFWNGVPPKSTFQQRDLRFIPSRCARLARATWKAILEGHAPERPFRGPLGIHLGVVFPHTSETRKMNGGLPVRRTARPDGVNILKMVEDVMTELKFWKDDSILASETVERWNGEISGVFVRIVSLKNQETAQIRKNSQNQEHFDI